MDEFDVFLDAETRKLVLHSLIHLAKQLDNRQFIFITPQDVSGIPPDPKVRISKLNPPERHDVAGGLTQQTLDFASQ
jgi:chromosome segregation ATPase